jgi:hypothetical protein
MEARRLAVSAAFIECREDAELSVLFNRLFGLFSPVCHNCDERVSVSARIWVERGQGSTTLLTKHASVGTP